LGFEGEEKDKKGEAREKEEKEWFLLLLYDSRMTQCITQGGEVARDFKCVFPPRKRRRSGLLL